MKTWHYRRIKFVPCSPQIAPNGDIVRLFVHVKNSNPKSAFRQTNYALGTLGL